MADTYLFDVAHVGKEGTGYFGKRYGRIDKRTTVTVQAKSLEEAKTKVKNSPEVARNKQQAARRQAGDETSRPKLVVRSIIQNPGQPDQKILKETAFQKKLRKQEEKKKVRNINTQVKAVPFVSSRGAGPNPLEDKSFGFPKPDLINIFDPTSDYSGIQYTKADNEFKIYNDGGVVKGAKGGFIRQRSKKVRIF
tara:strand:+ start:263 stop:844 length:582 start_codon:yes stop_codon:yes gene_type:complete